MFFSFSLLYSKFSWALLGLENFAFKVENIFALKACKILHFIFFGCKDGMKGCRDGGMVGHLGF